MSALHQIKASAGSGKTYSLTRCFLRLLVEYGLSSKPFSASACARPLLQEDRAGRCSWGDILAVTFTNAAAAEMRDRLIRNLKNIALGKEDGQGLISQQAALRWVDAVMRDLGALNIRTIDSLLHLIVRSAALELRLHPDFQPVFASSEVIAPYMDLFMERAWQGDDAMRELLRQCCEALVHASDSSSFLVGDKLSRQIGALLDDAFLGKYDALSPPAAINAKYRELQQCVVDAAQHLLIVSGHAGLTWDKRAHAAMERLVRLDYHKRPSTYWKKDDPACLFRKGSTITPETEAAFAVCRAAYDRLEQQGALLRSAAHLAPFVAVARLLVHAFRENWSEEGVLPGLLIPQLAQQALNGKYGVADALCRLGTRLTHYLLDEFQDTSEEQWQALRPLIMEALSRGGSLTWVGDVKQSIYGWRQAKPELFDDICQDQEFIAAVPDIHYDTLSCNWRSATQIIEHNNNIFSPLADFPTTKAALQALLPENTPDAVLIAASSRLTSAFADTRQQCAPKTAPGGVVRAERLESQNAEERRSLLQTRLTAILREDIQGRRPWGDVLVLVRSNSMARELAEGLVAANIPVITENSLLLAEHPLVVQSVALLSFLDDPDDDISLWTILTGSLLAEHPLAADLDWAGLHSWRAHNAAGSNQTGLWKNFRKQWPDIWQALLEPFFSAPCLMPPYDIIMEWYDRLDAEARFPQAEIFLRRFMEVLYSAEEKGLATLSAFLEHWRTKHGEEKVPMPENVDAVRIMTIHKSKGLEAPVVIVPITGFELKNPPGGHCIINCEGLRVLTACQKEVGTPYFKKLADEACESIDLLYVAFTRAREELYILRTETQTERRPDCAAVLDLLWQKNGLELPYEMGTCPQQGLSSSAANIAVPESATDVPRPVVSPWRPMHWLPQLKIFRNPLSGFSFRASDRGQLAHFCLEHLHLTGKPHDDAERALAFGLAHYQVPVPDDPELKIFLLKALSWFAAQPQAAQWLRHGLTEQSLVTASGQILRMDLLTHDEAGPLVIDYKSGQPSPVDVVQMRRYLACIDESSTYAAPARGLLVYLALQRFRLVMPDTLSDLHESCSTLLPDVKACSERKG
ncbi:MAG: UvrD-helicase domain-containing protein [Desulfovibrio sp.]|nr:UvrD-helicase domain-containing protein [Desulfovibrio sp.]